jgi:hypothetical protein
MRGAIKFYSEDKSDVANVAAIGLIIFIWLSGLNRYIIKEDAISLVQNDFQLQYQSARVPFVQNRFLGSSCVVC